ncbi:MAG: hypothetical protein ABSH50_00725 [Bryobacteraceae bacterium]|jgi:hypothetical protein
MPRLALALLFCSLTHAEEINLSDPSRLKLQHVRAETATYRGLSSLKVVEDPAGSTEALALIKDLAFHNGAIEVDVAGTPSANADPQARGFIGVVFRVAANGARCENIYIRPTNGRATDQLRRNHATQYESIPDWPWHRLRQESPGVYESYADMAPGEWTHLRVLVHGINAALYVNGAAQPCLLVHDLKLGDSEGGIGLWIGPGTEGYFSKLTVSREP